MAEPDFRLKVGADVAASVNQFKQDLQDIVKQLESNPPKIKVKIDDKSVTDIASEARKRLEQQLQQNAPKTQIKLDTAYVKRTEQEVKTALQGIYNSLDLSSKVRQNESAFKALTGSVQKMWTEHTRQVTAAAQADVNMMNAQDALNEKLKAGDTEIQQRIQAITDLSRSELGYRSTVDSMTAALAAYDRETQEVNDALAELARRDKEAADQLSPEATEFQDRVNALARYQSQLEGSADAHKEVKHTANDMRAALADYERQQKANAQAAREQAQETDAATGEMREFGDAVDNAGAKTGKFTAGMQELGQYLLRFVSIQQVISQIENLVKTSVELDSSFTQLQIVTKESDGVMREFGNTAADIATRVGASIADVVDSATTFARLGYSLSESATLSEFTTMLQNVGDIDVSSAQNAITSIVKAFGDEIDISNIETVMDKLVTVGNGFPISVSQIAEGMTNASSALAAAGNSFDQSVALLTAANTTVQDAARSSTGLRTIAARLRNVKTELDDLGETMTEAKYQELVSSLTDAKVSLVDQNGELRSTYDILKDLAAVWDDLSSGEQAALATNIAGKRVPGRTEMCA